MHIESGNNEIDVSPWRALRIPWNFFGKDGKNFDAHTVQIGTSHKKDHSFQKEARHFGLQSSLTTSIRLEFFTVNNHIYALGLIFWPTSPVAIFKSFFALTLHLVHIIKFKTVL